MAVGAYYLLKNKLSQNIQSRVLKSSSHIAAIVVVLYLAMHWAPLGHERDLGNFEGGGPCRVG